MEKEEWKPFRNALDKSDRKKFDDMWDLPKWYISACSNSVQYVRLHPIIISILFHHYKELKECISEVERIEAGATDSKKKEWLTELEEEEIQKENEEVSATTLERVILLRITHIFQIINISPFLSFSYYFLLLCSHKG